MRLSASVLVLGIIAIGCAQSRAAQVELRVLDSTGQPCPARVHLRDSHNHPYPGYADSALMSHSSLGGFFYTPGSLTMDLPTGQTKILVGRGFEYRPVEVTVEIQSDTSFVIRLDKPFDMRSRGWFSGDVHMHSQHEHDDGGSSPDPEAWMGPATDWDGEETLGNRDTYFVTPEGVRRVALAEDLAQSWLLDSPYEFTGGPHALSTAEAGIYFCTEYRNQAYGHASFLGQKTWLGQWCCGPPHPAYPMLIHLWWSWGPEWDEAMVLCHPQTGGDFFDDSGWPGLGLGRELPVQAALDRVEALEIASYSNDPDVYLLDWYRLLNCGLVVPPAAGTDALLNAFEARPAGGYRVYVKEQAGVEHSYAWWLEGLKAGRCFVTDYPLIPRFTVNGVEMGGQVDLAEPGDVQVSLRIECVLPLSSARIIRNGETALQMDLPSTSSGTVVDTIVTVPVDRSSWLALRVDGTTILKHATSNQLFAHTAPVQVAIGGAPRRSAVDAGYFMDWLDSLWMFVQIRDHWQFSWQPTEVLARINETRGIFGEAFTEPPLPCGLLTPAWGDTFFYGESISYDWTDATDPEPGDRVCYYLEVSVDDSTFADPDAIGPLWQSHHQPMEPSMVFNLPHYWRVFSEDRGGNRTLSEPPWMWYYVSGDPSGAPEEPPGNPVAGGGDGDLRLLSVWPNPAAGRVLFRLGAAPAGGFRFDVLDVCGGRVAGGVCGPGQGGGRGVSGEPGVTLIAPGVFSWDGRDSAGQHVPSGCYWLRLRAPAWPGAETQGRQEVVRSVLLLR
jgi:hypothetical protein